MAVKADSLPFEKALEQLEEIVSRLESGEVALADAVKMYEQGIALRARCLALLADAEKRIRFLAEQSNGEVKDTDPPAGWSQDDR